MQDLKVLWFDLIMNLKKKLRNRKRLETRNRKVETMNQMMNEFQIKINTIDNVKRLSKICEAYIEDIDISSGRYVVDAKSMLAIFSFDLTRPLTIKINSDDLEIIKKFNEEMSDFRYED